MRLVAMVAVAMLAGPAAAAPRVEPVEAACRGVPETESHLAVLLSRDAVLRVEELKDGARIVISARPYASADWLRRVIHCHVARTAALGREGPVTDSPLDVEDSVISVSYVPGTFVVDVTAADAAAAKKILVRARALLPPA